MSKIRKPNHNNIKKYTWDNDNTVVEGVAVASDLVDLGKRAAENTIKMMSSMYPKDVKLEQLEQQLIDNEAITDMYREASIGDKEKIDSIYEKKIALNQIRETERKVKDSIKKQNEEKYTKEINELKEKIKKYEESQT